jgi:hypothetical protein
MYYYQNTITLVISYSGHLTKTFKLTYFGSVVNYKDKIYVTLAKVGVYVIKVFTATIYKFL